MAGRERLFAWLTAAAGVSGAAVSVYLTVVHFSTIPLVCSTSGAIDCERVLSSGFAVIGGSALPTSVSGIVWFSVSAGLAIVQLAARGSPPLLRVQLAWSVIGLATVIGLVFVEIVLLGAVCLWCTAAHALVIVTFVLVITMRQAVMESGA